MPTVLAVTDPEYMTPKEVAEFFKVSTDAVIVWADAGKLHPIRTVGGHRRFPRAEVEQLFEDTQREHAKEGAA